jgi:1-acyl-sn-glycerol-3-phosphate acyltransferase
MQPEPAHDLERMGRDIPPPSVTTPEPTETPSISIPLDPDAAHSAEGTDPQVGLGTRIKSALGRGFTAFFGWFITNLTSGLAFVLYRVLNRTNVYGRKKIGRQPNTLILPNHRTMIDSYLVGHLSSWPWGWIKPSVLPYHPAAQENFFRNKYIGWFSRCWRCIPVRRGIRDFSALQNMIETLPKGQMVLFPEGTRSRDGRLKKGRPGSGKLIKDTRCRAIPCYVEGMDQVLPIGCCFPRIFKKITVIFGDPIPLDDLFCLPDGKETSQKIIDRVMDHIAVLKDELNHIEQRKAEKRQAARRNFQKILLFPAHMVRRLFS